MENITKDFRHFAIDKVGMSPSVIDDKIGKVNNQLFISLELLTATLVIQQSHSCFTYHQWMKETLTCILIVLAGLL